MIIMGFIDICIDCFCDEYKVTVSKAGAAEVAYNKNLNKKAVIKVPKSKLKKYKKLFNKKTGFKKPMKIKK
ncbi:MAG: hypothetical protein K6F55_05040 [Eubacterium sp.]|nr:hypothetical protein [Eubacterium sp.]